MHDLERPYSTPTIKPEGCVEAITREQTKNLGLTDGYLFDGTPFQGPVDEEAGRRLLVATILWVLLIVIGLPLLLFVWAWVKASKSSQAGWLLVSCAVFVVPCLAFSACLYATARTWNPPDWSVVFLAASILAGIFWPFPMAIIILVKRQRDWHSSEEQQADN